MSAVSVRCSVRGCSLYATFQLGVDDAGKRIALGGAAGAEAQARHRWGQFRSSRIIASDIPGAVIMAGEVLSTGILVGAS